MQLTVKLEWKRGFKKMYENVYDEIESKMARCVFPEIDTIADLGEVNDTLVACEDFLAEIEDAIDTLEGQKDDLGRWQREYEDYFGELENLQEELESSVIEVGDRVRKHDEYNKVYTVVDIEDDVVCVKYYPHGSVMYDTGLLENYKKVEE